MNEEIKQRLEMIHRGEVPQGYKKTKVGIMPSSWIITVFGEIAFSKSKKYDSQKNNIEEKCIELEHINQESGTINGYCNSKEQLSIKNIFNKTDVLYGKLRPYLRKYFYANIDGVCSTEIWVLKSQQIVISSFLYRIVQSDKFNSICNISCCGSKMPRADWEYVEQSLFPIPPLREQEKIAEILATCDKVIELKEKLIAEKQKQKKWLMQNLLTGKKRLKGFGSEWKKVKLGDVLSIRDEKQVPTNEAPLMAFVASIGISPKGDRYDRSFLVKDIEKKYKRTEINDFIYSSNNLDVGSIGLNKFGTAVISVVYEIFTVKPDLAVPTVLSEIIQTPYNIQKVLAFRQGALYGQYKIHAKDFLSVKIRIPNFKEQTAITNILITADKEVELLQKDLYQWKQKKKALMQLLLTGKVRVK